MSASRTERGMPAPESATAPQQSRAKTLRRLGALKDWITITTVLGFAALSGVIATQHSGASAATSASSTAQSSAASGSQNTAAQ